MRTSNFVFAGSSPVSEGDFPAAASKPTIDSSEISWSVASTASCETFRPGGETAVQTPSLRAKDSETPGEVISTRVASHERNETAWRARKETGAPVIA